MNEYLIKYLKVIILLLAGVLCINCTSHATEQNNAKNNLKKIKSISWTDYDNYLTIEKGEKVKLAVTYYPAKKIDKKLKWKSSKKKVVSVSKKGVIKGKKNGTATITAKTTDGSNKKIKLKVTVGTKVSELSFTNTDKMGKLYVGQSYTIKAAVYPSNASNKQLIWSSSDTDVATVDNNGKVTPVSNGFVLITAESTDGTDVSVEEQFDVETLVSSVSLSLEESGPYHISTASRTANVKPGVFFSLKPTIAPDNATNKKLTYVTSNDCVARVSDDGKVFAVGAGIAVITATSVDGSKKSGKFTLYVNEIDRDKCTFIAHRGFSELAPDNSLAAFELAFENKFDYVELDVWPTIDKELVVCHDESLINISGNDVKITDLTLSQAMNQKIMSGNGISNYSGEYIPSLDQVLALSVKYPDSKFYIELKTDMSDEMLEKLLKLIKKYDLTERVRILSFKKDNLSKIRNNTEYDGDKVGLGYLTHKLNQASIDVCEKLDAEVGVTYIQVTKSIVDYAHQKGVRVNAWTVPNIYMAGFLVNTIGVDSITSNYKFFE